MVVRRKITQFCCHTPAILLEEYCLLSANVSTLDLPWYSKIYYSILAVFRLDSYSTFAFSLTSYFRFALWEYTTVCVSVDGVHNARCRLL